MFFLTNNPIDPGQNMKLIQTPKAGGIVTFEGRVRNHHEGKTVHSLSYEAYGPLAEKEGRRIMTETLEKFDVLKVFALHRTGDLAIEEIAIWVGVSAVHRRDAFRGCAYIIDEIKQRLPIWKKEFYADGTVAWVNCQHCVRHQEPVTV